MPEKNPTVSVIIPTYNRAHLIGKSIQSVLNQTYKDFELIVIDDGSTDKTEEVVRSFNDIRIRYICHKENRGANAARNTGIQEAKGEYIAFQDSDDEWLPEKLDKQMRVFENAPVNVGVVYTGFWRVKGDKKIYIPSSRVKQKEGYILDGLLKGNFVSTQTVVVKKECFQLAGMFDEYLPRLQDWELFIRISKAYEFRCVDEPLVISYHMPDSISSKTDALIEALILIIEKHFEDFKKDRGLLSKWQCSIGRLLFQNGEITQGTDYFLKAIKTYPLYVIKCLIIAFISLLGERVYAKAIRWKNRILKMGK